MNEKVQKIFSFALVFLKFPIENVFGSINLLLKLLSPKTRFSKLQVVFGFFFVDFADREMY